MKKLISFLTAVCCLAGSVVPFRSEASETTESESVPRIVFENEPVESDDLIVTKTVVSAIPGEAVPETEADTKFYFTLLLNGKAAANKKYHVYEYRGEGNDRVLVEVDEEGEPLAPLQVTPFQTDSFGRFYLKAGQRAEFRSADVRELRVGTRYTVTEEETEGYRQSVPAAGASAAGELSGMAAFADFTNEYQPNGTGTEAVLEVKKTVPAAGGGAGYLIPGDPEFTFLLKLDNRPYEGSYELWDMSTGTEIIGDHRTEDGIFTLKGNQKAVFTGQDANGNAIRTNMQYEVRELDLPEDWRVVGKTGITASMAEVPGHETAAIQTGATKEWTSLEFTNAAASFAVSKKLEEGYGNDPEAEFTFELKKSDGALWSDVKYYIYNTRDKELIPPEQKGEIGENAPDQTLFGEAVLYHMTTSEGRFTLKFGQTAVFVGIPEGESYSVKEVAREPEEDSEEIQEPLSPIIGSRTYAQSYPLDSEGRPVSYSLETVTNPIRELQFRNKPMDGLSVTKNIVKEEGEAPLDEDVEFHFVLYRVDGEKLTPQANASYTVGKAEKLTLKDGSFTLKADETANFTRLAAGTYKVVEDVTDTPGYSVVPEEDREGNERKTQEQTGTLTEGGSLHFLFNNYFTPHKLDLRIVKVNDKGEKLSGAQFMLFRDEAGTVAVEYGGEKGQDGTETEVPGSHGTDAGEAGSVIPGTDEKEWIATTNSDGIVTFEGLQEATYYLKEVTSPSGYLILPDPIKIQVKRDSDGNMTAIVDDGKYNTEVVGSIQVIDKEDRVEITIINSKLYELPNAGGMGIYWYTIGGMLLMMAAALILYRTKFRSGGDVGLRK